jgi:hypothetical protein
VSDDPKNAALIAELKEKLKKVGPFEAAENAPPRAKKKSARKQAEAGAELSDREVAFTTP